MTLEEFGNLFDSNIAPMKFAESYDNVGILVGECKRDIKKILCVLDITSRIVDEAISCKVDLIVCHHPLIFTELSLVDNTIMGKNIIRLIKHNIAAYAAHTNLDSVSNGINDYVADILELKSILPLYDTIDNKGCSDYNRDLQNYGIGRIGILDNVMTVAQYREIVKDKLQDKFAMIIGDDTRLIKKVAVINGSGGGDYGIIDRVKAVGDCLVTSEVKHHIALYAYERGVPIVQTGHFNIEVIFIDRLVDTLKYLFLKYNYNISVQKSSIERDLRR